MSKRAVVVGVNDYSAQASLPPGWSVGNLSCCVADVQSMQDLLKSAFLFDQVDVFTDAAATRDAIISAIQDMLTASGPGDVACFAYSGHGGRFPADPANPGRYYEAIIPASGSPITDLDIFSLADQLDQSVVNFTLILDSCYSGGIHEDTPDSTIRSAGYSSDYVQACVSDMGTVIPCGVALPPGSSALDGNVSDVVGQGNGVVCSVDDNKSLIPVSKTTVIAACRYDEEAMEQNGHGALTQGFLDSINQSNPTVTYLELIDQLRDDMQNKLAVAQTPTLLGQENRQGLPVLAPWDTSA
jgi:hypothetical protein